MTSVGWATLDVIPSFKGLAGELDRGTSGPMRSAGKRGGSQFGDEAGRAAGGRFGDIFSKAAKASLLGVAGGAALAFKVGADSIEQASDLGESLNAVNVTYGKQATAVKKLGRESAKALGLSNSEFNGLAVQYSAFAKTIGGDTKTVKTLDDLTTRASDFASVMNLEVAESAGLFQSGLAGETEPLRKYGIDLSAAAVESYAFANGIAEAGDKLTESEKVQARYGSLMEQTSKVQGDFANTSDSLANRQRILSARWDDARAKLGQGLLPIIEDATGFILDKGIPAFEDFSDWFNAKGIPAIKDFGAFVRDDLAPPLKDAAAFAGDLIGFLKNLPSPAKYAGLAALIGGGTALKLRGGGGALGTAGKALGISKPIPVFVTNMGLGGLGAGAGAGAGGAAATFGAKAATAIKAGLMKGSIVLTGVTIADAILGDPKDNRILDPIGDSGNRSGDAFRNTFGNKNTTADSPWASIYKGDPEEVSKRIDAAMDASRAKAAGLGRELDLVGARKVTPRINNQSINDSRDALAKFIGLQIEAGRPVTPYINTTSIERAIQQIRTLNAEMAGNVDPARGVDNGVPYASGGGGGGTGGTGGGASGRVVIDQRGSTIVAHDYNDFTAQLQTKAQAAGLGGRPTT